MEMGTWKRWIIKKRGRGSPAMKTAILSLTMIVAAMLTGCASTPQQAEVLPRDLRRLVFEVDGSSVVLQSIVTNCQSGWRRAVHTTRDGRAAIGCWRFDREGNLVIDFETGERFVVRKEALSRRGVGV